MNRRKIIVRVMKEDRGYSATAVLDNNFIASDSETFDELKSMIEKVHADDQANPG